MNGVPDPALTLAGSFTLSSESVELLKSLTLHIGEEETSPSGSVPKGGVLEEEEEEEEGDVAVSALIFCTSGGEREEENEDFLEDSGKK